MPHTLITHEADLDSLPTVIPKGLVQEGSQITFGDLHGNTLKFLHLLLKHGIATGIDEKDYQQLRVIYDKPCEQLTEDCLQTFHDILGKLSFDDSIGIRLIGDEFADRGKNDYFTLMLIQALKKQKIPLEIVLSNHSIEFIEAVETLETNHHLHAPMMGLFHAASLENLNRLLEKGLVSEGEIRTLVDDCYKPYLNAIGYSLSEDEKDISIFSHAAIGLNTIKDLAKKLKVDYCDDSIQSLTKTIDAINEAYRCHVKENKVHTLYDRKMMYQGYCAKGTGLTGHPFEFLMWNRSYDSLDRPEIQNGYRLSFIHGHDDDEPSCDNIYNLDENNVLGKQEGLNEALYNVLTSHGNKRGFLYEQQTTLSAKKLSMLHTQGFFKGALDKKSERLEPLADINFVTEM
jgi:WipA-like, phosphatase domain